jgi:hypothetical protein
MTSASSALRAGTRSPRDEQAAAVRARPARPRCNADERREDGRRDVAAERGAATTIAVVGERAAAQAGDAGAAIGDPFDQTKRSRGRTERRGHEGLQKGRWHLITKIGEKAGATDAGNTASEPAPLGWVGHEVCAHLASLRAPLVISTRERH